MKFLCGLKDIAMDGWSKSLKENGYEFVFWDQLTKPVYDVFDEEEPDFFICSTADITRGVAQCLMEYSDTIPLFYDNPYIKINEEQTENIIELNNSLSQPTYMFNFCDATQSNDHLTMWKNCGFKTFSTMRAAFSRKDIIDNNNIFASNIILISDYNPYLNKYILPLCYDNKFPIKIFGNGWPVVNAVGLTKRENHHKIYQSSLVSIDISENIIEPSQASFDILKSGSKCLSNTLSSINNPSLFHFKTPDDLYEIIKNETWRKTIPIIMMPTETYDDRISFLLTILRTDGVIQ